MSKSQSEDSEVFESANEEISASESESSTDSQKSFDPPKKKRRSDSFRSAKSSSPIKKIIKKPLIENHKNITNTTLEDEEDSSSSHLKTNQRSKRDRNFVLKPSNTSTPISPKKVRNIQEAKKESLLKNFRPIPSSPTSTPTQRANKSARGESVLESDVKNARRKGKERKSLNEREEDAISSSPLTTQDNFKRATTVDKNYKEVYSTCIDLFQHKKITTENAFSLRLLECLDSIITSPDFDMTNMQLVGRTLDAGVRIYVCRVDYTYNMVMELAAKIGLRAAQLEKLRQMTQMKEKGENNDENEEGKAMEGIDEGAGEDFLPVPSEKRKKARDFLTKKIARGAKDKITINLADEVESAESRQKRIRQLFVTFMENRQFFNFNLLKVKGRKDQAAIEANEEFQRKMNTKGKIFGEIRMPKLFFREAKKNRPKLSFIRFYRSTTKNPYDAILHDVWGRPRTGPGSAEEERKAHMEARKARIAAIEAAKESQAANIRGEYQFDAQSINGADFEMNMDHNSLGQYDGGADGMENSFHDSPDLNGSLQDDGEDNIKDRKMEGVRNMEQLAKYYQALKELHLNRQPFLWPKFNKKGGRPKSRPGTAETIKKSRVKKPPQRINFSDIKWSDPYNCYKRVPPHKIQLDDKLLEKWSNTKSNIPFIPDVESAEKSEAEYNEAFQNPVDHKQEVDRILAYFNDAGRNLLQLFHIEDDGEPIEKRIVDERLAPPLFENAQADNTCNFEEDLMGFDELQEYDKDFCNRTGYNNTFNDLGVADLDELEINLGIQREVPGMYVDPDIYEDDYDEFMGETEDGEIRYAKKPKPINMRLLKKTIMEVFVEKLLLDQQFKPTQEEDTKVDMITLINEVHKRVDERTNKFLSISLILVASLHVMVELKLFSESSKTETENTYFICHGKSWIHKDHVLDNYDSAPAQTENNIEMESSEDN